MVECPKAFLQHKGQVHEAGEFYNDWQGELFLRLITRTLVCWEFFCLVPERVLARIVRDPLAIVREGGWGSGALLDSWADSTENSRRL